MAMMAFGATFGETNTLRAAKDYIEFIPLSQSSKGMLIYERDGERLELPPTEQGYNIMNSIATAIASRTAKVAVL